MIVKRVLDIIRHEIHKSGVLSFARFMELALYCPDCGYYETKKDIGRRGDFYTSVSAGELFGQLLAFQFSKWLEQMRNAERGVWIIEAGAHDGTLARDILRWLQRYRPRLFQEIEYVILEPSARRREWQAETLKDLANIQWFGDLRVAAASHSALRAPHLSGIIFSNELLDAMPVRRFGWDAKGREWFEWGVALDGEKFIWARGAGGSPAGSVESSQPADKLSALQLPAALLDVLPDNYTLEISPAAENWWRNAAGILERGWLMTLDYGLTADELFSPARPRGTLRAYSRHHVSDDVLANPGEQDITAHVNFSAIQKVGEDAGLNTEYFGSQAKFLTEILAAADKTKSLGNWGAKQTRQFQTLTHPEHLGRAFRVLVQSR